MSLYDNQLSGEIPPELGSLANLRLLYLSYNQLSGEIPPELASLANLTGLFLDGNQLSGCVPASLRDQLDRVRSNLGGLPPCTPATEPTPRPTSTPSAEKVKPTPTGTPPLVVASSETDRAALVALYNATDGPNWRRKGDWMSDDPLGVWYGVTVGDNGRVIELILKENQLSGEIPAELGNLTNLSLLNLDRNQLSGEIPAELGNLA